MITLQEVKKLLEGFSFKGLSLVSLDEEKLTFNFRFEEFNPIGMPVQPTVAAGGKVLVFTIPDVGKIGVSRENMMVRYVDAGLRSGSSSSEPDTHVTKQDLPADLVNMYHKAVINSALRPKFCARLWAWFNQHKFSGQMEAPRFEVSTSPSFGGVRNARGYYKGDPSFRPGRIWMASFMFNARIQFFYEVFLHEMCHQAAWTLSCSTDHSEQGHGPIWQQWMTHVGLDPRRYDPTDDYEYADPSKRQEAEESLTLQYGPKSKQAEVKALKKMKDLQPGPAIYLHMGRILHGRIGLHDGHLPYFEYNNPHGYKRQMNWPSVQNFVRQGLPNLYHENKS